MAKKNRKAARQEKRATRPKKEKTGKGWEVVKGMVKTMFKKDEEAAEPGTAFRATTTKDIIIREKRKKKPAAGFQQYLLPGVALAAAAFLLLKKK